MLDLALGILHHLFAFALAAVLLAELVSVRRDMDAAAVRRVATMDTWYGVLADLVLGVGFARAIFAANGWDDYLHNALFWAKIGTFMVIALLSVPPTLAYLKWRRTGTAPTDEGIAGVRRYLWTEALRSCPREWCSSAWSPSSPALGRNGQSAKAGRLTVG
jgi:putative membrane protein